MSTFKRRADTSYYTYYTNGNSVLFSCGGIRCPALMTLFFRFQGIGDILVSLGLRLNQAIGHVWHWR